MAFLGLGEDPIWVRFGHPLPHHVMYLRMHFHRPKSCQSRAKGTNSPGSRSATYCGDGSHGTGYVFRGGDHCYLLLFIKTCKTPSFSKSKAAPLDSLYSLVTNSRLCCGGTERVAAEMASPGVTGRGNVQERMK